MSKFTLWIDIFFAFKLCTTSTTCSNTKKKSYSDLALTMLSDKDMVQVIEGKTEKSVPLYRQRLADLTHILEPFALGILGVEDIVFPKAQQSPVIRHSDRVYIKIVRISFDIS